jgi:predicted AAA+ superfamily ATPase
MFGRDAMSWLLEWKEKSTQKPLIIRGARQVGKTSLVKEFGKGFDLFIALNLDISNATCRVSG